MTGRTGILLILVPLFLATGTMKGQDGVIYNESQVPAYTLPDPLTCSDGSTVGSPRDWFARRRPELIGLFRDQVYGKVPEKDIKVKYEVISINEQSFKGLATEKQIRITFSSDRSETSMTLLLFSPNNVNEPVPAFLGLNFAGNHTITREEDVVVTDSWVKNDAIYGISNNKADSSNRGVNAHRWPLKLILEHGYALATIYYGDIDPDFDDGFKNGIHALFRDSLDKPPKPGEWGSIAAWAWGLCRALDYLETDGDVDAGKVAVIGHSRLGKTALWAGALDTRFAMVVSNESGCGGAALSRRCYGETIMAINDRFPHWFCDNYTTWNEREDECPLDQHELIALIAPRPVYVASAEGDKWSDPRGEFLSCLHADPVYKLLGTSGLPIKEMPATGVPVRSGTMAYHIRSGGHDLTQWDWQQYLEFADLHLK